jgi:hypothetical protein
MANINQITAPRVDFLDERTGKISREWYMFLYNLYTIVGAGTGIIPITSGGTGIGTLPTNGQLLIGNEGAYSLGTLSNGAGISVTNGPGTIVLANTGVLSFSGGTTGLTPVAAAVGAVVLGGTLNAVNGGTGQSAYTIGDLLYADTATTLAKLPDVVTGNALISGGVGTAPAWGKIGLTTHVSGVLLIANGGTNGTATPTAGAVAYGTGTAYGFTAAGTTNQALVSAGAGTPTWDTLTSGSSILYGNGSGLFSNVTIGSGVSFVGGTLSATGTGGTITSVTATSPVVSSGGTTPDISLATAYGDTKNPYAAKTANYVLAGPASGAAAVPTFRALVAADIPALPYGTGTVTSVAALTLGTTGTDLSSTVANSTTTPVITLNVPTASATNRGALSSTDWTTFNNKQPAGTYVTSVTGTAPVVSSGGTTPAISMAAANTTTNGYLTSTDWNTFNGKGSGTVTSVSFTGGIISVATATTTPALTVAGTSGGIPYFASGTTWASSGALTQYGVVYGGGAGAAPVATAAGTTGQVLTATTGGAPTWAAPATSGTVTSVSVVSANGFAGTVATATTTPAITLTTSITGLLKGNGTAISAAVANTDYVPLSTVLTKTADYTITNTDTWIINNKTGSAMTLTFPAASAWTGRSITVKNMQAQLVNSASSNIVPIDSTTAGTAILLAVVGNWATMVSDGTNWVIMQAASNNNLLLE